MTFGNALEACLEPSHCGKFVNNRFHILTHRQLQRVCGCTHHKVHLVVRYRITISTVHLWHQTKIFPCTKLAEGNGRLECPQGKTRKWSAIVQLTNSNGSLISYLEELHISGWVVSGIFALNLFCMNNCPRY